MTESSFPYAPAATATQVADAAGIPDVPVLNASDVQGDVLAGFKKPHQTYLFLSIGTDVQKCKDELAALVPSLSTLDQVWYFNNAYRLARKTSFSRSQKLESSWVNLALTWKGLRKVWEGAPLPADVAFIEGLRNRARTTGDVVQENWRFGGTDTTDPDYIIIIAGDDPRKVSTLRSDVLSSLSGSRLIWEQATSADDARKPGTFGFKDGITQPRVKCKLDLPGLPDLDAHSSSAGVIDAANDVELGSMLIGHVGSGIPAASPYTNSSYVVYRRYVLENEQFHEVAKAIAADIHSKHDVPAFVNGEYIAAQFIGRWSNGAFLGNGVEGQYADDLSEVALRIAGFDKPGDTACPFASHIRKTNPRFDNVRVPRIIRRGMPFRSDDAKEIGLLFVSYQASIESQFEFIMRSWMNNPNFPRDGSGHDIVAGQCGLSIGRERDFELALPLSRGGLLRETVRVRSEFAHLSGGCYALLPSISTLRRALG